MKNNFISVTLRPFKYLVNSERTNSIFILSFLIPQILLLIISKSWNSIIIMLSCLCASLGVQFIDGLYKEKNLFSFIQSFIQGILISLFIPSNYPFWAIFIIAFLTLLICTKVLGGFAANWINPVVLTVSVAWLLGINIFPNYDISQDILLIRNPSLALIQNGTFNQLPCDSSITSFLNRSVFNIFAVSIPEGYVSLFWDTQSVIPAFRFNLVTIVSSIVLVALDIVKPLIPGIFVLVYSLLIYFIAPIFYSVSFGHGDILLALLTSGTLFSAIFLMQWAGTLPMSFWGKLVYGIFAGIIGFLIIGVGTSPVGSVFTILVLNLISPFIQSVEKFCELLILKNKLNAKVKEIKEGKNA